MIRFLQRQRAKKGFTIVELIVVIAIMAILMAVILPQIMSKRSEINSANSAARDFYSAIQTVMTKYSLYEGPLSSAYRDDPGYGEMRYYQKLGGNYPYRKGSTAVDFPSTTSLYVEVKAQDGNITAIYTHAIEYSDAGYANGSGLYALCQRKAEEKETVFGKLLKAELESRISYRDGSYYAKVTYNNAIATVADPSRMEAESVRVSYTGYSKKELPKVGSTVFTTYRNNNMYFGEDGVLANGDIFGVCAPRNSAGKAIGQKGTSLN